MKLFGKDPLKDLIVIAEVGVNHEGSVERAKQLIHLAKGAGADAVKFQCGGLGGKSRLARQGGKWTFYTREMEALKAEAESIDFPIFASAFTPGMMKWCGQNFPVLKIASRSIKEQSVIEEAAKHGKPLIMSTGKSTIEDIEQALRWAGHDVILMHCVSAYPVPIEQANILAIPYMKFRTEREVGYSNHVIGPEACLAAVAYGANVIEVHFTWDRNREFRDHKLAMEPADLHGFIEAAQRIKKSLGRMRKFVMKCEGGGR